MVEGGGESSTDYIAYAYYAVIIITKPAMVAWNLTPQEWTVRDNG